MRVSERGDAKPRPGAYQTEIGGTIAPYLTSGRSSGWTSHVPELTAAEPRASDKPQPCVGTKVEANASAVAQTDPGTSGGPLVQAASTTLGPTDPSDVRAPSLQPEYKPPKDVAHVIPTSTPQGRIPPATVAATDTSFSTLTGSKTAIAHEGWTGIAVAGALNSIARQI